jgi:hypothetical protein
MSGLPAYYSSDEERPKPKDILPAQHRKTYDWLQPSAAAASHSGPDRPDSSPLNSSDYYPSGRKKSHKRRGADAAPGPGKNWRKGVKKWVGVGRADDRGVPPKRVESEASPEPRPVDTTPFVLADATKLGHPVFSKPISATVITLGTFPKVSSTKSGLIRSLPHLRLST